MHYALALPLCYTRISIGCVTLDISPPSLSAAHFINVGHMSKLTPNLTCVPTRLALILACAQL